MRLLVPLTAFVAAAAAKVAVMLPFYNYPKSADWQKLLDAIDTHKDLHFYVIINPHNGPTSRTGQGGVQSQTYGFNNDWVTQLDKLNKYDNAQAIGYVATDHCTQTSPRSMPEMQSDIDNWATWSLTKNAEGSNPPTPNYQFNISINGIFFDETAPEDASGSVIDCYRKLVAYVNDKFKKDPSRPAGLQTIVFNPGTVPKDSMKDLFTLGDAVITAETCYTDKIFEDGQCGLKGQDVSWNPFTAEKMRQAQPPFLPTDKTLWPKSSILVHGFAQVAGSTKPVDAATLLDSIKSVTEQGVHSLYFTTKGWATFTDPPADVTTVVQDIAAKCEMMVSLNEPDLDVVYLQLRKDC